MSTKKYHFPNSSLCRRYKLEVVRRYFLLFFLLLISQKSPAAEGEFKVSVGELPHKGHLTFAQSMEAVFKEMYPSRTIKINVYPMARSIQNVIAGEADVHMPLLRPDDQTEEDLKFSYSTRSYTQVVVVVYSNKKNPLTRKKLQDAKYTVSESLLATKLDPAALQKLNPLFNQAFSGKDDLREALKSHLSEDEFAKYNTDIIKLSYPYDVGILLLGRNIYKFPISTQTSMEGTMKMVNSGRLHATILTQDDADKLIREFKLKNIHRELYAVLPVHFVIAKNLTGKKADETLTKLLDELQKRGILEKLSKSVHETNQYRNWQP